MKNKKHADFCAPIGFAFFPFVFSCFGSFGPTAVLCHFSLADLIIRQYDTQLARWPTVGALNPPPSTYAGSLWPFSIIAVCYGQI